jgi:hypothetical protein
VKGRKRHVITDTCDSLLARFSYEDLQRQISIATKRTGNLLYELAHEDEARFVDQVSGDLKAARFRSSPRLR